MNIRVDKPIPEQGSFPKDKSWEENKQRELEDFIKMYPEFYHSLRNELFELGKVLDNMFFEMLSADDDGVSVQYYPYKYDWTLSAYWSHTEGGIVELSYTDNKN